MKKNITVANCFILLFAVVTIAGCVPGLRDAFHKDAESASPMTPETRIMNVDVKSDKPFYCESSWDNYNTRFFVDTRFKSSSGLIEWADRMG
jgi:hypothetical protein